MWRLSVGSSNCLLSAVFAGCVMSPADDARVQSQSAIVPFSGTYSEPDSQVSIQQLDTRRGRWETRALARTSREISHDEAGHERHAFAIDTALDPSARFWHWSPDTKLELITTVRAHSDSRLSLTTFFQDVATAACIRAQRARGDQQTVLSCAAGDGVRLRYEVPVTGATDCSYGAAGCNTCVSHVQDAFARISSTPSAKVRYRAHGGDLLPPFNRKLLDFGSHSAHIQGVARLPRIETDAERDDPGAWFVLTRSSPGVVGGAGLFLVASAGLEARFYYPIEGVDHPGGLSTLGQYVFVASDCDDEARCGRATFVDIFDFATPGSKRAFVQRFRIGDQGEPGRVRTVSSVAVTRMATGHMLIFVQGKDSDHEGWFYVSDGAPMNAATSWSYRGHWARPLTKRDEYQSTNFVTECESGDIYMVGMGNGALNVASLVLGDLLGRAAGTDVMSLFKLARDARGELSMDMVGRRSFDPGSDGYCTFRAAASVHATPSHDLVLYCSTRKAPLNLLGLRESQLKLAVFTP